MKLNPTTEQFVLHWGEMGNKCAVNRTVAQIHALLYLTDKPMNAEEVVETLGVACSNVSNSIKELQSLELVHTVYQMGDRHDYFTTNKDVWGLAKTIIEQRYKRELAPTVAFLDDLMQSPEFQQENPKVQLRIRETHQFVNTVSRWMSEMTRLSTPTRTKILTLVAKVQRFLR